MFLNLKKKKQLLRYNAEQTIEMPMCVCCFVLFFRDQHADVREEFEERTESEVRTSHEARGSHTSLLLWMDITSQTQ